MPKFLPGLQLSELFYQEAVRPLLKAYFPDLRYSAALLGPGSEVLGYDTPQSTDHHWGPRVLLFLDDTTYTVRRTAITQMLSEKLPTVFYGYSTSFGEPDEHRTRLLEEAEPGRVKHRVELYTIAGYFTNYLGVDPRHPLRTLDWLIIPEQKLLTVTSGKVFYDSLEELNGIRKQLAYYPHDIWLYLLSAQWRRIEQEEPFMGRCGDVGDELGSQVIAARLVRDVMKLCFLMERRYAPYIKWFGTAFARLQCADELTPLLQHALRAGGWKEREALFSLIYERLAEMHNALGITQPLETKVSPFYTRPYMVIHAERFVEAIRNAIGDEEVKNIEAVIGGVDQFVDNTDVLSEPKILARMGQGTFFTATLQEKGISAQH